MSLNTIIDQETLVYDEDLIASIFVEEQSEADGNLPVDFEIEAVLDEILNSVHAGSPARAIALIDWLFRSGLPLTENACLVFVDCFTRFIPDLPRPIVSSLAMDNRILLARVYALARQLDVPAILLRATTPCYRLSEARGEYARARRIIARARSLAEEQETASHLARLTCNFGFEYLLEGNYAAASPHFAESIRLFEELGDDNEVANVTANLLTCQFALLSFEHREALLPELLRVHAQLVADGDWRQRKTMRLLAQRAAAQGRLPVAIAWARRALGVARQMKSQLQHDDELYLNGLRLRSNGVMRWQ